MNKIKFYTKINGKKYLMQYRYQNFSFPLFVFEVFTFKLFGLYWIPVKLENCGSLYPKECVNWTSTRFKEHAINTLNGHLNMDSDTKKSIKNFSSINKENSI